MSLFNIAMKKGVLSSREEKTQWVEYNVIDMIPKFLFDNAWAMFGTIGIIAGFFIAVIIFNRWINRRSAPVNNANNFLNSGGNKSTSTSILLHALYTQNSKQLKQGFFISAFFVAVYFISNQYGLKTLGFWSTKLLLVSLIITFTSITLRLVPRLHTLIILAKSLPGESIRSRKVKADIVAKLVTVLCVSLSGSFILQTMGIGLDLLLALGGILGVALGFAARDFLGSFLGTAVIYWDKPFVVGDTIRFNIDKSIFLEGVVEKIDWRFTIIKPKGKSAVFVPNSNFILSMVENLSIGGINALGFSVKVYMSDKRIIGDLRNEVNTAVGGIPWIAKDGDMVDFEFSSLDENSLACKILFYVDAEYVNNNGIKQYDLRIEASTLLSECLGRYGQRFSIKYLQL